MSGRIIPIDGERHREIRALLPWFLSGALDPGEQAAVRRHLSACPECQAELLAERSLAAELRAAAEDAERPDVDRAWAAMHGRLAPRRTPPRAAPLGRWLAEIGLQWRLGGPWLRWTVAAQACLLLAVGGLWLQSSVSRPAYRTLGALPAQAQGNIVVVFRSDAPEAAMRQALTESRTRLVDGPTATGAYVLRAPPGDAAASLAALRGRAEVVLAEPIGDGGGE